MNFLTFLFVAVAWMPNGSPQPPIARVEVSMEACMADEAVFASKIDQINNDNTPAMRMTFYVSCRPVINTSEAKHA